MYVTGVLHPGAMGSTVAAACSGDVVWVGDGRSDATRQRAAAHGLRELADLAELVNVADTIVSVCPPASALEVAASVADLGFAGLYVDANAISPERSVQVGRLFDRFVDGGIIGPPATSAGTTRMYLSGPEAKAVAARWQGSALDVRVIGDKIGDASAMKMAYAAWTKGSGALLLAVNALTAAHGLTDVLNEEWALSQPDLADRSVRIAPMVAPKAWRFEGEMSEIASTFDDAGLTGDFHRGAAEIYRRMAPLQHESAVDLERVVLAILAAVPDI